jgi:hypothetical protein
MRAHPQVAGVQGQACGALTNVCAGVDAAGLARLERAADAGAIEAAVASMRALPQVAGVQDRGCEVLANVCSGVDAAGRARAQRAAAAGAIEAVVAAMRAHPQAAGVQASGCRALIHVCYLRPGDDEAFDAGRARQRRAVQAGGRALAAAVVQAHPDNERVQRFGELLLEALA